MTLNKQNKKTIVFDLDGTLSNFERIDHEIIDMLFGDSRLVKLIDKLAWKVNRKDIIKNTMGILVLRLVVYSVISRKSIRDILKIYREEYFIKSYHELKKVYYILDDLSKKYRIRVVSNNKYSKGLAYKNIEVKYMKSKFKYVKLLNTYKHDIDYIIGNNLSDDIFTAKLLNIKPIYIGKEKFAGMCSNRTCENITDIFKII